MTPTTPEEMQRLLAHAFDRQGWEYDLTLGRTLLAEIERAGGVDADALARQVPTLFIERNHTSRPNVAAVIERAVGGRSVKRGEGATTLVFADNRRYEVRLARGAQITNSNLNLGDGTQVNINLEASKEDVMAAIEVILRAGLTGEWNEDAARELASVIESRNDVDFEDVREITAEVVEVEEPTQGKVKALLGKIAVSGLGGALGTGISSGLGEMLGQLPM
jgi:hypothetical protein